MLNPNLPLLRGLETLSAVDRNAVLVVIAQQQVGVFARALIADAESNVRRQLIPEGNRAADPMKMLACAQWNWTENPGETARFFGVCTKELSRKQRVADQMPGQGMAK